MNLREALRNKKLNNKGSAIVLVIIAMGFIGLLASMILWMTYMNYLMKTTDKKSTNNFYSAEVVMEQIKVGLQDTVSDSMSKAYRKTLESYTLLDNDDQRKSFFQNEMKKELTTHFMGADASHYDFELIRDYVDTNLTDPAAKPYANVRCVNFANASKFSAPSDPTMAFMETSVSDNTIVLRNVDVVYTDQKGFISAIHSDFRLAVPEITFSNMAVSANFADYSLVANEQLLSNGTGSSLVTIEGSVYGGNGGSEEAGLGTNSVVIGDGANWLFQNGSKLVTKKAVSLGENSKLSIRDDEIWVGNLSLDAKNGILDMDTSAHVKDDLTVWKENGRVTLAGSYYGFGTGRVAGEGDEEEDGSGSSAIIINGKKSTLDLKNLKNIWIGGRSYIATKQDTKGYTSPISTIKNVNIPMSESIAVRGSQVAYLVPPEALCVYQGSSLVRSNPISAQEYTDTVLAHAMDPEFIECDLQNTLLPGTEHYLSDYTANPAKGWKKIVARGHNGANLIYYYMNMEPEQANEFFADYYGVDRNKNIIDNCLVIYSNGDIKVSDAEDARIEMSGNWLGYDKANKSVSLNEASVSSNEAMMSFYYGNEFDALNAKLIPDKSSLSLVELSRSVYENLVDEDIMKSKVGTGRDASFEFTDTDGTTLKAVVSTKGTYTYSGDSDVRLILSQGSVYVTRDFKGIVIAKKNIYVSPGITIEAAPDDVSKVMGAKDSSNNYVYMMFRDGSKYAMTESSESVSGDSVKKPWGLNELVVYENWSKQ